MLLNSTSHSALICRELSEFKSFVPLLAALEALGERFKEVPEANEMLNHLSARVAVLEFSQGKGIASR